MTTHCSTLAWRIPVDRGAWRATDHGVAKSRTGLTKHSTAQQRWPERRLISQKRLDANEREP